MTRAQFLNDLYRRLEGLTQEQAEQHLTYYAEMLADRMEEGMSEDQAVASMEDIDVIARRILEEEGQSAASSRPPEPPAYPDASRLPGGGGARAYQGKEKRDWRRPASILLWALAILCALGALGRHLIRSSYREMEFSHVIEEVTDNAPMVQVQEGTAQYYWEATKDAVDYGYEGDGFWAPLEGISAVNIQIVTGAVWVSAGDGGGIFLRTDGDERQLHWEQDGSTLNISSRGSGDTLYVAVPDDILGNLTINASSADVMIDTVNINTLDITTVSGDVRAGWVNAAEITVKTTSGDVYLDGLTTDSLNVSTASGDVEGLSSTARILEAKSISGGLEMDLLGAERIALETTSGGIDMFLAAADWTAGSMDLRSRSGDIDLGLPAELGFTLTFDTTSGDAELEMACLRPSQNVYVWGDGACGIGVNTISGGLEVESW